MALGDDVLGTNVLGDTIVTSAKLAIGVKDVSHRLDPSLLPFGAVVDLITEVSEDGGVTWRVHGGARIERDKADLTKTAGTGVAFSLGNQNPDYMVRTTIKTPTGVVLSLPMLEVQNTAIVVPPRSYSTTFLSTENPLSEGGNWVNGKVTGIAWNNMQAGSGNAFATAMNPSGTDDNCAHLTGFAPNHYIEGVVHREAGYNPTDPHELELLLRARITANNVTAYEILMTSSGPDNLVRWNGPFGDFTVLAWTGAGIGALVNGDVIRAQIIGSAITVFKNSIQVMSATDSVLATGDPGIGSFMRGTGNVLSSFGWQSITASDV